MINSPLISIIIPVYNRAHLISETLDSVMVQTYENWECIIVDDGSKDNTLMVIENYSIKDERFKVYSRTNEKVKGPSSCRNIGLENAIGEYVLFLDSDDLLLSTCLEDRKNFARKFEEYDFWIFTTKTFLESPADNFPIFNQKIQPDQTYLTSFLIGGFPYCIMGPLWRKIVLKELNGFDERLTIFEDPDLHIRAYLKEYKSKVEEEGQADSFYRISLSNTSIISEEILNQKANSAYLFYIKYYDRFSWEISRNAAQFFNFFILPSKYMYFTFKFYNLFLRLHFFNIKQIVLIPFVILGNKISLNRTKGFGYYSFQKFIFK